MGNDPSAGVNANPESKTFLDFEISDDASFGAADALNIQSDNAEVKNEGQSDTELSIPDAFDVAENETVSSFVQTPNSIRPTYLPRFTEVSETYRMQDDPRPRQRAESYTVKVGVEDAPADALDPTTETVEEKAVQKVVVTSAVIRNSEPTDETMKVLKFSTPAIEPDEEHKEAVSEPMAEPKDEVSEFIEETVEELIVEPEEPQRPKNMTIPDPEETFSVVEFSGGEIAAVEEPRGADDSEDKNKTYHHGEFNSASQRDMIKDRFLDTLMSIRVRLAGAFVLLLSMVAMDVLPYFGINVFDMIGLGGVPYARAVFDMQFSLCIFIFALPELIRAIKVLVKGKLAPELFTVFTLATVVLSDIVIVTLGVTSYLTFGVLHGLQCFVAIAAAYSRVSSDFTSFKLVSRNVAKNVLDKRLTRELPRENLALDGAIDEYNSKTARMFRTVFVSGFFKRASKSCENFVNVVMMIGVGLGISLVTGLVAFFLDGNSILSGVQSAAFVFTFSLPAFSILVHKLPYKHVCKSAAAEESAFVGESSIYDSADVDVFAYEDTEIFGIEDVSLRKVHLYGKVYNTPKAMKQMYALFSVVGGPLDFVFSSALDRKCPSASDVVIEENGVRGMHEGHSICAGTEEYMRSHGIAIPEDDYRTNPASTDSTKVMYGAEDGEVYVKFFIRYSFSEEFTMLLPDLKEKHIVPLIYTRDPNITNDLLKVLTLGEDIIRVMKKFVPRSTEEKTYRRVNSGVVTHGDKGNAINMVLLAKKYASFQSSLAATELISLIVGVVLAVVLAIGDMIVLPTTLLALWQVVWCAVLGVRSKLFFRHRHEKEEAYE